MSVAKIEFPETMDETRQRPRVGGLNDPRLGTIDRNFKCQTVSTDKDTNAYAGNAPSVVGMEKLNKRPEGGQRWMDECTDLVTLVFLGLYGNNLIA